MVTPLLLQEKGKGMRPHLQGKGMLVEMKTKN
jgi:hypothetical protein